MHQTLIASPWTLFAPTVYRMMERKWVDLFFETGELRLSSFETFRQHQDEQRKDSEGENVLIGRAPNATIYAKVRHGNDAFVLCATAAPPDSEILNKFSADAAIQIFNTTAFAAEISHLIPSFVRGIEGHCFYTDTGIDMKLNEVDLNAYKVVPDRPELDSSKVVALIQQIGGGTVYFRKAKRFRPQNEYRWVFLTGALTSSTITIKVPKARDYCLPWYPI